MSDDDAQPATLAEFLAPGINRDDLPALAHLLRAGTLLDTFSALFHGNRDQVLIRLLVMRELGARSDAPRWSPQDLQAHFAYVDPVKLETVLKRLRQFNLLLWDAEDWTYQLSGAGRIALSALATVLQFGDSEDADLAYITAQVAAGQAFGNPAEDLLQLLLAKYRELQKEFDDALMSGSEFRIRRAKGKFDAIEVTVEKGNELIGSMMKAGSLEGTAYRNAQAIGQAQSRLMRMHASFQRELNKLELERVHLGASGLSSSDVVHWLRTIDRERLAALVPGTLNAIVRPLFCLTDVLLDQGEHELLERDRAGREAVPLPDACVAPQTESLEAERLFALEHFLSRLTRIDSETPLTDAVVGGDYPHAAYRLSLLALMGDAESRDMHGPVAELAQLPLALALEESAVQVGRDEVAEMSAGTLRKIDSASAPDGERAT